MSGGEPAELAFDTLDARPGLRIIDPIERCRYDVGTDRPPSLTSVDRSAFSVPVDAAVRVATAQLVFDHIAHAYVRDAEGEMVAEISPGTERTMDEGRYDVEINAPVKLYLQVQGPFTTTVGMDQLTFAFEDASEVLVGARSYHQHPATTLTTTSDPVDVLETLPSLASALKTTSPERSFPTLRGHPPLVTVGDRMDVPAELSTPDTGVRLELPATHRAAHVAAPLVYYLGADVGVGESPRLVTETGFEYALDGAGGFEATVERTLKQAFFLDCCTRTEGHYQVDLHERAAVEADVDLDFAALYDQPLAAQLEAYLSVPYDAIDEHLPTWGFTAHLPATEESTAALPFVVDELGIVRTASARKLSSAEVRSAVYSEYDPDDTVRASDHGSARGVDDRDVPTLLEVEDTGSIEEAWFGEHAPLHGSKSTVSAFRNALDRTPKEGPIEVVVVCNDEGTAEARDVVDDVYGSRDELEFTVTLHHDLTTSELREVLDSSADFLHYIGHIDGDGIQCQDGHVDARTLDSVDIDAFLLNGCRSYGQGLALIEAGSIGGVVTVADVVDSGAVTVGQAMARLLNLGFTLRAALSVARRTSVVGGHYLVVGNGYVAIAQLEFGSPMVCDIEPTGDEYLLTIESYLSVDGGMGSMVYPAIESVDRHFLYPKNLGPFSLSRDELSRYLDLHAYPAVIDGEWFWRGNDETIKNRF